MKHLKIFEEFVNEFFPSYDERYTEMPEYVPYGIKNTKPIQDAMTKVIDTVFKKPKYNDMWAKGRFSRDVIGIDIRNQRNQLIPLSITLTPNDGFLIQPDIEDLDKEVEKYGTQFDYEQALAKTKVSPKQIKDAIKELEAWLNKYTK